LFVPWFIIPAKQAVAVSAMGGKKILTILE
jgi:hypothetical protein